MLTFSITIKPLNLKYIELRQGQKLPDMDTGSVQPVSVFSWHETEGNGQKHSETGRHSNKSCPIRNIHFCYVNSNEHNLIYPLERGREKESKREKEK